MNYSKIIARYNDKLCALAIQLRILDWLPGKLQLSTGVVLTDSREIARFRTRLSSGASISIFDELYSLSDENARISMLAAFNRSRASDFHSQRWHMLSASEQRDRLTRMWSGITPETIKNRRQPVPWNAGQTKLTDERLAINSRNRTGSGNPMFGTAMSDEHRTAKSRLIKSRIASGEWTPHIHNSRTHRDCKWQNMSYRSSWEAMYASLNPTHEYETVRIQYIDDIGNPSTYIVDFVDRANQQLVEIKPSTKMSDSRTQLKFLAAHHWCEKNDFTFVVLTEEYFVCNWNRIPFNELTIPNLPNRLRALKYEASKANANR